MYKRIIVTRADLEQAITSLRNGSRDGSTGCLIATALRRALPRSDVAVGIRKAYVDKVTYSLSGAAVRRIGEFCERWAQDAVAYKKGFRPFSFILKGGRDEV